MNSTPGKRRVLSHTQNLDAPPEAVFPLLCPVREYDWIDGWSCRMVHSRSGLAEAGCVFTTELEDGIEEVWVVSRYEPPATIAFTKFAAGLYTVQYDISLAPTDDGATHAVWTQVMTGLGAAGNQRIDAIDAVAFHRRFAYVEKQLNHFLKSGDKLRPDGSRE